MKFLLPKEVFNYDLKVAEARLLLILSSYEDVKLDDLPYKVKMWISGSRREYSKLSGYEKHLDKLGLINKEIIEEECIVYKDLEIFNKSKNLRQLFLNSFKDITISEDLFKILFGNTTHRLNENFRRTCEQIGVNYSWKNTKDKRIRINKTEEISLGVLRRNHSDSKWDIFNK